MISRKFKDILARQVALGLSIFVIGLAFLMAFGLYIRSKPILAVKNVKDILFTTSWHPSQGQFGLWSFISGTLWVTIIAIIIAVPLGILSAIYLAEYAPKRAREFSKPIIDLLGGLSPIIYGVWGILVIVPMVRDYLMPFFNKNFHFFPFQSDNFTGFSALSAGIVLAVMVLPIIILVVFEVIRSVPIGIREASLALGATKWETVKYIILRKTRPGIIAAIILGLSRAFGETMAVLMVAGCSLGIIPNSFFDTAYPLPAFIANTYGEMMSIPLYDSAVLLAALVLLGVTALFNMVGWGILIYIEKREF